VNDPNTRRGFCRRGAKKDYEKPKRVACKPPLRVPTHLRERKQGDQTRSNSVGYYAGLKQAFGSRSDGGEKSMPNYRFQKNKTLHTGVAYKCHELSLSGSTLIGTGEMEVTTVREE